MLPMSGSSDNLSPGMGTGSGPGWLSFLRIVDIPFETCVAALESWRREGRNSELQLGQSTLRGPIEHDRGSGRCWVEVRLARGPLRPPLRMRLDLDCWSRASSTALELIPCGHVGDRKLLPGRPPPAGLADPLAPTQAGDPRA